MTIGAFIRLKRLSKGLSQQYFATQLGFGNRSTYHRLESGRSRWRLEDFIKVALLLDERPGRLLDEFLAERGTQ